MSEQIMRILNQLVVDVADKSFRNSEIPAIIYEAPTGYGKTTSSLNFYHVSRSYGLASGLIHVLPMRSIATELYCKMINSISDNLPNHCKEVGVDPIIKETMSKLSLSQDEIGYQFMDFIDPSKTPYFLKAILITTFNSFFHNLARFTVSELWKSRKHYETPRASILTSCMVLDEAHLYGGDPGSGDEKSLFTALVVSVKSLVEARVPILIESATLPDQLINILRSVIRDSGANPKIVSFKHGIKCGDNLMDGNVLECHDDEYLSKCLQLNWNTDVVSDDKVIDVVKNHVMSGHKVLVVRNTVEKAIETYCKLKEDLDDVELIHGRFTAKDRAKKLKLCRKAKIVVSTQVIEAGVNLSFNVLITDAASPSSVVQRAGRVLRYFEDRDAYVYVVESEGDYVYDREITTNFTSSLKNLVKDLKHVIDWRIPSDKTVDGRVSFLTLINQTYQGAIFNIDPRKYVMFSDVISSPTISQKVLSSTYAEFPGLLYSSILFPIYVGDGKLPDNLHELIENSVPLSLDFISSNLPTLLESKDGKLSVLELKCDEDFNVCELTKNEIDVQSIKKPIELLNPNQYRSGIPLSFVAKPKTYSQDLGLVVKK
ncbi:MAG: CRISPR-associated helicase Cas3' [Sulfolobales archaeon]|nr:CRISPR-associated helicase Cas3' [Sulfolobales archaeon]MDW7970153.1 CRISPR-associated helicase Cas3' [Sulfolobales archaeon]